MSDKSKYFARFQSKFYLIVWVNKIIGRFCNFEPWCFYDFSNRSMDIPVSFISNKPSIVLSVSPNSFKAFLYICLGKRWKKGSFESNFDLQICWCPPNGFCHGGKAMKTTLLLCIKFCKNFINRSWLWMCSITSRIIIKSYLTEKSSKS